MERFIKIDSTYYRESALEQIEEKEEVLVLKVRVDGRLEEFEIKGEKRKTFPQLIESHQFLKGAIFSCTKE